MDLRVAESQNRSFLCDLRSHASASGNMNSNGGSVYRHASCGLET